MRRTIADELKEEGAIRKSQQTLIRLLKRRFGDVPDELTSTIRATDDGEQLDAWLDQVVVSQFVGCARRVYILRSPAFPKKPGFIGCGHRAR